MIVRQLEATRRRVLSCVEDVSNDEAIRSPSPGLSPLIWQIGHLANANASFAVSVGAERGIPADYNVMFRWDPPADVRFPQLAEVKRNFERAHLMLESLAQQRDLGQQVGSRSDKYVG